jgi:molecular chaperone DnaK (HSP70)
VIVEMLAEAFNALPERQGKPDIRKNEKAMKRLFSQSINVKDILSANKLADVKIPDLLDKITLKTVLARSDFEARSDSIIQKVTAPIDKALEHANLTIADID